MKNTEAEIEKLRQGGMSAMDIATKLEIPVKVVAETLHDKGAIEGSKFLDLETNKLKVIQLRDSGMKQQDIANAVGLSKSAVARFLRKVTHVEWWNGYDKSPLTEGIVNTDKKVQKPSTKRPTPPPQSPLDKQTDLSLVDDSTKSLVKGMKDDGASLKDISVETGINYHNVRNFLLKKTYAEWWQAHDAEMEANAIKGKKMIAELVEDAASSNDCQREYDNVEDGAALYSSVKRSAYAVLGVISMAIIVMASLAIF